MAVIKDPRSLRGRTGSAYPPPFDEACRGRVKRALGNAMGLGQYGVNLVDLAPGAWSSQRHWHQCEDEFVYVLKGEVTLVTDAGENVLGPGMAAGFPAGEADGHHLVNRTSEPATYLEVGTRSLDDAVAYPDIDLKAHKENGGWVFTRRSGTPLDGGPGRR